MMVKMGAWSVASDSNDGTHDILCKLGILTFSDRMSVITGGDISGTFNAWSIEVNALLDPIEFKLKEVGVVIFSLMNGIRINDSNLLKAKAALEHELVNENTGWVNFSERMSRIDTEIELIVSKLENR